MSRQLTTVTPAAAHDSLAPRPPEQGHTRMRLTSWIPSWAMITTKQLEVRRRRGLMIAVVLLSIALPVLVLGLRLLFHAVRSEELRTGRQPRRL